MTYKNPGMAHDVMGIVQDTENVRRIEQRYGCNLVDYSAYWTDNYRAYVWDKSIGQWRGVYPLQKDDLQPFGE